MRRKRLFWQIYPPLLIVTLLSLAVFTWYVAHMLRQSYLEQLIDDLSVQTALVEDVVDAPLKGHDFNELERLCRHLGDKTAARITVILPDGEVVGDSHETPARMDNHADRPEIRAALTNGRGMQMRYSHTLKQNLLYVARRISQDDEPLGVVRTSVTVSSIEQSLQDALWRNFLAVVAVAVVLSLLSLWITRRISRPLEQLKQGAARLAQGELDHHLPSAETEEVDTLAEVLNQMAQQLAERIRTVETQRNEREAILSSMVEGVLAVDGQQRVISLNAAAAQLLPVDAHSALGRTLPEAIRLPQLQALVAEVLSSRQPREQELIVLNQEDERRLQAHGTILKPASDDTDTVGVLVVLHDVTRLRRLENVRRDFVANVSHELKTPVTSIKGFVETLLDGAMNNPTDTERFLKIVEGQTDRLNAIIDDLLDLSRIEQEAERNDIALHESGIREVLDAAVDLCQMKAGERNIRLELDCPNDLMALVNPTLLEQAVVNLIDNAIKYSDEGQTVYVEGARSEKEVLIRVHDRGCGIAPTHLPRLFERFYRVDKARSRTLGGTGLGLAIVKHIAHAHNGRVSVESTLGKGSTFCIHLPASDD